MAKIYSLDEQLDVLSDEQLEAIKQELLKDKAGNTEGKSVKSLIGRGITRGFADFGEGALLGFQGRPISEHSAFKDKTSDKYEELLKTEMLKNQIDPSRLKSQQDIEDEKIKKQVLERKLREQNEISEPSAITPTLPAKEISQDQPTAEKAERPPKRVKIGEDEHGLNIYGDNPDYADALKQEAEIRSNEFAIKKEERSIDLIAKKAAEKDRQLNISKISRLTNLVDLVETEYAKTKTPGGATGLIRRPLETFGRWQQITENQRQDKAYGDFVKGIRVQLARAMSEVGNLSEPEQKAAMDLVPSLLDDPRTAKIKLQQLRDLVAKVQSSGGEALDGEIPSVGETFKGEKVLKIRKKQ